MSTTFQIITQGRVYVFSRRELRFEVTMEKVQKILRGTLQASTFEALHKGIAQKWILHSDFVRPFGDRRQNVRFVCSFNLDQDLLTYSDETGNIQLPLDRLREPSSDPLQRSEFTSFEIAPPPQLALNEFPPPSQKLSMPPVNQRHLTFSGRVLSDFADQWRHMLRSPYAESTFLRLANAVVSIATCNFRVDETFTRQHITHGGGPYVSVIDIPSWDLYQHHLFVIGGTTVVLNQDLLTALKLAREDVKERSKQTNSGDQAKQQTYLLLSVRHMLVCQVDSAGTFSYTAPTTLMDGLTQPSPYAMKLLLQALSPDPTPPRTAIHKLPLEIQNRILEHVSEGPVEAARLGCILDLGSPCTWARANDWQKRGGPMELLTSPSHRTEFTPVESKIYFGDVFSGVSYR